MAILQLIGKRDNYLFDPENAPTVLKRNGKFGSVYAGARTSDNKRVLIKFLNPELKKIPAALHQFRLEADIDFEHPFLRKTYEWIEAEEKFFLIQEYINGSDLRTFLKRHSKYKNSPRFIIKCVLNVLEALDHMHSKNFIHCDIKPSNILIAFDKEHAPDKENPPVKLIDFGQAKNPLTNFISTTKPFSMIYSPPEQVLHFHDLIDPSSDLYSAGITLYELITNKNPFGSNHPEMLMHKQVSGEMEEDEKIPRELFKIIQKATAKKKFPLPPNQLNEETKRNIVREGMKKRFQSAKEMKAALESFLVSFSEKKHWLRGIFGSLVF